MVDSLFVLIELLSLSITVPELSGKMCPVRLFLQGVDLFAVKFYLDKVIPHQSFLASVNERHWATRGEDRIPLRSLVLTQYHSMTDGQTDGRTDAFAVAHTVLLKLVLPCCKNQLKNFQVI